MSVGVDVNILLYASDGSSALHEKTAAFLEQCANGREVFCLAWLTIMSDLRRATHPSIFVRVHRAAAACVPKSSRCFDGIGFDVA